MIVGRRDAEVAVLGGGIAGCLTACLLADRGYEVAIVEQRQQLMDGASRWNDGKIHLGFTFTGTESLATAALLQEGAGLFVPILESVIGRPVSDSWFGRSVVYVVDRESLYDSEVLWRRAAGVARLAEEVRLRLPGLASVTTAGPLLERLSPDVASMETGMTGIAGAWRTAERHISARAVAEELRAAVAARGILVIKGHVRALAAIPAGWRVELSDGLSVDCALAVNCLWEGRAIIDRQVAPENRADSDIVIRYKHCLFGTNANLELAPSTRILGPFGDVATYGNGDAYLSWYPVALAGRSDDGTPPIVGPRDPREVMDDTLRGLGLPPTVLGGPGASWVVGGGYIVAYGRADVDVRETLLHTRDRATVRELRPGYFSVDTGKYTLGPLMAARAVELIGRARRPQKRLDATMAGI